MVTSWGEDPWSFPALLLYMSLTLQPWSPGISSHRAPTSCIAGEGGIALLYKMGLMIPSCPEIRF